MQFVMRDDIPKNITPTYCRVVVAYRPEKEKPYRVRITVGGDRVIFDGEVSTKAADLPTVKIHLNSVVSTPNAMYMVLDIKDFSGKIESTCAYWKQSYRKASRSAIY
jgi:hypothetical protein